MEYKKQFGELYKNAKDKFNIQQAPKLSLRNDKGNAEKIFGKTINSFSSLSLDTPLILFSISFLAARTAFSMLMLDNVFGFPRKFVIIFLACVPIVIPLKSTPHCLASSPV